MESKLMTLEEIAEKYEVDDGTVSLAMSLAGVFRKQIESGKRAPKQYDEAEAVDALIKLCSSRKERAQQEAERWSAKGMWIQYKFDADNIGYELDPDWDDASSQAEGPPDEGT